MVTPQLHSYNILEDAGVFYSCARIFYSYFKEAPSMVQLEEIDQDKVLDWVQKSGGVVAKYEYLLNSKLPKSKNLIVRVLYLLKEEILAEVSLDKVVIYYSVPNEQAAFKLVDLILNYRVRKRKSKEMYMVVNDGRYLQTVKVKLKNPKISLSKHYNDDLVKTNNIVIKALKERNRSGVILFHGVPGTGKSTYIRHLIFQQDKKVIFMPPSMAGNLDVPQLTNLLIENRNSIIVIEDAEELLLSREKNKNSSISMLLNLTDGLLGESLGIQIIATFNTHLGNIDKALLRKGRLIALYEFKPLAVDKTINLVKELKPGYPAPNLAMTLADIFNLDEEEKEFTNSSNAIGFLNRAI